MKLDLPGEGREGVVCSEQGINVLYKFLLSQPLALCLSVSVTLSSPCHSSFPFYLPLILFIFLSLTPPTTVAFSLSISPLSIYHFLPFSFWYTLSSSQMVSLPTAFAFSLLLSSPSPCLSVCVSYSCSF